MVILVAETIYMCLAMYLAEHCAVVFFAFFSSARKRHGNSLSVWLDLFFFSLFSADNNNNKKISVVWIYQVVPRKIDDLVETS